jgi:hypothetical protein
MSPAPQNWYRMDFGSEAFYLPLPIIDVLLFSAIIKGTVPDLPENPP